MVAVLFIVPAVLWAVPRFGAIGAAWAWLALNVGYVFVSMHFMHQKLVPGEKWRWYRDSVLMPLIAGGGTALIFRYGVALPQNRWATAAVVVIIALTISVVVMLSIPASRDFLRQHVKSFRENRQNG
jgi:cytochrome b subunit of formate dehydrogenase